MITLRDSLVSSSSRPLPIRCRGDLTARRQQFRGRSYWIVKEPLGLNYFRFHEEEFAILQMLDGQTSLDEIKERFEAEYPPQKITLEELQQFLGTLHRSGLVIADVPGQGRQLHKRRGERKRQEWLSFFSSILSLRFKGVDPERFLDWLYPKVSWFFTWTALVICLLLGLSALTLITAEFDQFRAKLPAFQDFFNLHNVFWLSIVLGTTKVFHELGHGLSCKHFGGECHELGVMLLVLSPCLYCNVSDSWLLPNKWHRMAIGAAGMYVELVLASLATFIWWNTAPGLPHYLALNVMFVCSVTTVVFNANPLLRYDGYYILADYMEMPNLRQKASSVLSRKAGEWFLGIEPAEDPFLPEGRQLFFVSYSIASAIYRWIVLASILWFLYNVFKPAGLQVIGQTIAAASIVSLIGVPLYQLGKFFYIPGRIEKVKKPRMYASLAGVSALLAAALLIPLPFSIVCSLDLQPRDAHRVYVDVPLGGQLDEVYVRPGQQVEAGQPLARLSSVELDLDLSRLQGKRGELSSKLDTLQRQKHYNATAGGEIAPTEEALRAVGQQLAQRLRDKERLMLRAPVAGVVLPPPERHIPTNPEVRLPTWSGTPFDIENRGVWLDEGELFCMVGDPRKFDAVLVVDQTEVEHVRERLLRLRRGWNPPDGGDASSGQRQPGPTVAIKLDALPGQTFVSRIDEISQSKLRSTPRSLSNRAGGEVASKIDQTGVERPRETVYQARAELFDSSGALCQGMKGQGRVYLDWVPLGTRLWWFVAHLLNFRM